MLSTKCCGIELHSQNITHNLNKMAQDAGIYDALWHPGEGMTAAKWAKIIKPAMIVMHESPDRFKAFDASNGWGTYGDFMPWLEQLLTACNKNPDSVVSASI
jgi:hypothetical protein